MGGSSEWPHSSQSRSVQADPQGAGETASNSADIASFERARLPGVSSYVCSHVAGSGRVGLCF